MNNNEAGLILKIDGFKDFNEALKELDNVIENIDSRLEKSANALTSFVKKAKATASFGKFVEGLGLLFQELNRFQTNSGQIIHSINSLTVAFGSMFDTFSKKRSALEGLTRQIANFSANRASLTRINKAIDELGNVRISQASQLSSLGNILTNLAKALDPLNKFRPLFGIKFRMLANQLASAAPGLEKFISAFGRTAETVEQSRLVFRNLLDLTTAVGNISKLDFKSGRFLGIFGSGDLARNLSSLSKALGESAGGFARFAHTLSADRLSFNSFERLIQSLGVLQDIRIGSTGIFSVFGGVGPKIVQLSKALEKSIDGFAAFGAAIAPLPKDLGLVIQRFEALADVSDKLNRSLRALRFQNLLSNVTRLKDVFRGAFEGTLKTVGRLGSSLVTTLQGSLLRVGDHLDRFFSIPFQNAGQDAVEGFVEGVERRNIAKVMADFGKRVIESFAKVLGIRSPSKVFRGFGYDITAGFIQGLGSLTATGLRLGSEFARSFLRGLGNLRSEIANFSRNLAQTAQDSIQRGLQTITAGGIVSFAQARAIQFPIQSAVEFEDAFAGVIKTVDVEDLGEEAGARFLEGIRAGLRELATGDSPVAGLENAQVQLAQIAEAAGQLGIAREDILEFTETMGQLSLATNVAGEEGAAMLAQFANIVQTTEFSRLGATLTALGNAGASTESQILEFAQRLAGAGNAAGLTEAQILAIGNAMASLGLNAEAGSSAFTQFLGELTKATSVETRTVTGAQRIAAAEREIADLQAKRTQVLRNLESAQDRLNRATTVSSRNAALNSLEKAQAQLAELDAAIQSAQGSVANINETAVFTLTEGSKELETFARIAGVSAAEFATSFKNEPIEAIQLFIDGLSKLNNEEQVKVLDELGLDGLRLSDTLRRLSGNTDLLKGSLEVANTAWEENSALTEEASKRFQTMRSQIERAKNIIRDLAISIGDTLLPDFRTLTDFLSTTVERLNTLAKENPELTRNLARAAVAVGALAGGFITLSGVFSLLSGGLLSVAATGVGLVTGAFTALTAIFFNPIGVIAGFAAIAGTIVGILPLLSAIAVVGVAGFRIFQRVVNDVRNNVGGVSDSFNAMREAVQNLFMVVRELLGPAFTFFDNILNTVLDGLFGVRSEISTLEDTVSKSRLAQFFDFVASRVTMLTTQLQRASGILQAVNIFAGFSAAPGGGDFGDIYGVKISQKTAELEDRRAKLTERRLRLIEQIRNLEQGVTNDLEGQKTILVEQGDTLSSIAAKNGISVQELLQLNPDIKNPNMIFAGQELRLKAGLQIDTTQELERLHRQLDEVERQFDSVAHQFAESLGADRLFNALSNSEQIVHRLTGSDIFKSIFGEVTDAQRQALVDAISDVEEGLKNVRRYAGLVPAAMRRIFSGDVLGGLRSLNTIFRGMGRNIRNMFRAVSDALSGENPLLALVNGPDTEGSGENLGLGDRLLSALREQIQKITGIELQGDFEALFHRALGVAKIAVGFVFGPAAKAALNIASLLSELIKIEITNTGVRIESNATQANFEAALRTHLLPILGSVATLVFGPAAGFAIGIARLVSLAIEKDFLGLGTLIEESGVRAAVEGALRTLQDIIETIFGGGQTQTPTAAFTGENRQQVTSNNPITAQISAIVNDIKSTVETIGLVLGPVFETAMTDISTGLSGFFDAIKTIDGEKVKSILDALGLALAGLVGVMGVGAIAAFNFIGAAVKNLLPAIGTAIADFINALGSLAQGDVEGFLSALGNGLKSLVEGAVGFTVDLANRIISALEIITGAELPSVEESWNTIVTGISAFITAIPVAIDNVRRGAELAFDNLRLGFELKLNELLLTILTEVNRIGAEFSAALQPIVQPLNDVIVGLGGQAISIDASTFQIDTTAIEMRMQELAGQISTNEIAIDELNVAGNDLGQGMIDGVLEKIPDADTAVRDFVQQGIKDPIVDELEIQSPSKWAMGTMFDLIMGFVTGLSTNSVLLAVAIAAISLQFQLLRHTVTTQAQNMARDFDSSANRIVQAANRIAAAINSARNAVQKAQSEGLNIPGFAKGGVARGLVWVGEQGRELIFAGSAMSVLNNRTSEALAFGYQMGLRAGGNLQTLLQQLGLFGGWRQYGGQVMRNRVYGFSEDGRPEVFQAANGQAYLLSSTGGLIQPVREASTAPIQNYQASTDNSINVYVTVPNGNISDAALQRVRDAVRQSVDESLERRGRRRGSF